MITNFKIFDQSKEYDEKKYWLVSTDFERAKLAFKEIGASEYRYKEVWDFNEWFDEPREVQFVYILYSPSDTNPWSYSSFDEYSTKWLEKEGYKFAGNVGVEDYEINATKFNI